jgi:hypothetical protein
MAYFIITVFLVFFLLAVALGGFVWIQIKCKPVWRLSSIAVLLIISCRSCSELSKVNTYADIGDNYARRLNFYITGLDGLALEGRTNEIHQACAKYFQHFVFSSREEDISNFNSRALDTYDLSTGPATATTTNAP